MSVFKKTSNPNVKCREAESKTRGAYVILRIERLSQREKEEQPYTQGYRGSHKDKRGVILLLRIERQNQSDKRGAILQLRIERQS